MSFRIFLLGLSLWSFALHAQETAAPNSPQPTTTEAAPANEAIEPVNADTPGAQNTADAADAAKRVPLNPADLLKVNAPRNAEEREDMLQRAAQLRASATQRRDAAEQTLSAAKTACWKKFLVSSCLEDARTANRKELSQSKHDDRQAQTLERNVRKYDAAEHIRQRDEKNAHIDAENERKTTEYHTKRAAELERLKANGVPVNPPAQ